MSNLFDTSVTAAAKTGIIFPFTQKTSRAAHSAMQQSEDSGRQRLKKILIPELNPLKTISETNLMKLKFFKNLIAVAEEKNLNQFFQAEKQKQKQNWLHAHGRKEVQGSFLDFSVSLISLSAAKEKLLWKPCTELAFSP